MLLRHTGGRIKVGGIGGRREGQTGCQSWHVASPVCNQHLYPSSLATAKHCNCLSHLSFHPQKCTKHIISIETEGRGKRRLANSAGSRVVALSH